MKSNRILGACSCWGAQIRSCEKGPKDLLDSGVFAKLQEEGVVISDVEMIYPLVMAEVTSVELPDSLPLIFEFNKRIAKWVFETMAKGEFPVVLAGDHSCAVGTWNGVKKRVQKPIGLLWIDAHMDAHTPETSLSGAWHGMPLAGLLGCGAKEMAQLLGKESVLLPEHVVLIGVRSFEAGEANLLERLGVKVYFMEEVKQRGFEEVLKEALEIVTSGTVGFGASIDLDVIDPEEAPGVGSLEPGGIQASEFLKALKWLKRHPKALCFEIVEYNPGRDVEHKTRELVHQTLRGLLR